MIEKPKRPKQPSIQERQPPRTLQELVNRYDLDNTKIYDFLDELVDALKSKEETVDEDISTLEQGQTDLQNKIKEIKKITVTGTTDSNGFILINGINTRDNVVISATTTFTNSQYGFLIPYCLSATSKWTVKVETWNRSALANTSITITVYYIDVF